MTKKAYIWENLDHIGSGAYHEGGGLMVITSRDPKQAVEAAVGNWSDTDAGVTVLPEADYIFTVPSRQKDAVVLFPDAGCC